MCTNDIAIKLHVMKKIEMYRMASMISAVSKGLR